MIHVVLFRSIYPRNVGMCARAIGNMGAAQLILVAPRCAIADEKAKQGAAHAQGILQNARVYASLADFHAGAGEGLRLALSGKDARLQRSEFLDEVLGSLSSGEATAALRDESPIYLYFGPEDDGLSPEEMALCHHVCRLPTFGEITSLNLSHAVLLALYLVQDVRRRCARTVEAGPSHPAPPPASAKPSTMPAAEVKIDPVYYPSESIRRWLEALGFDLSSPRITIEKTLNRILLSRTPSVEELRIIDSVVQQTIRKLEKKTPGQKD